MELEFHKKTLPYLCSLVSKAQTQEQTQEVRLPEGMPDIGNVVSSWAQVILRGKEWRGDRVGVNGGIMTWVMYLPEEDGTPQSVAAWMPFQMKWDIPQTQHDGTILLKPFLRSVDARSLSARKLMVRATFGVDMEAMVPAEAECYYPGELPEDIRILQRKYPLCLPAEAGEKPFSIEECFSISPGQNPPSQLIRYHLQPEITEWKLMADKLVFRGNAVVHALYRGEDGQLHTWHQQIPFSQYAELEQEFDDACNVQLSSILTNLELELMEDGQLCLKTGISCQYMICSETMIELVEDAYSNLREITPQIGELSLPAVLDRQTQPVRVEQTVEADAAQVLDLAVYADYPQLLREGQTRQIQIPGVFQLLYADPDGSLQSTNAYWEENLPMDGAEDTGIDITVLPQGIPAVGMSSNGISMQTDMDVVVQTHSGQGLPMVTGLELGEERKKDPDRPSLILRRAGEDCLWKIAKETGASVSDIQAANHLEGEPQPDQMLLIPIP